MRVSKKYPVLLMLLLFPFLFAGQNYYMAGGGVVASDSCVNLGGNQAYYDADHITSNVTYCKPGGTGTITLNNATVSNAQNHTTGGANSILFEAGTPDRFTIPVSTGSPMTSSDYYITMWIYPSATTGMNRVLHINPASGDTIQMYINSDNTVRFEHTGQGAATTGVTSTDTVNDAAWNKVEIKGSVSANKLQITINDGTPLNDVDSDPVTAFAAEPTVVTFGSNASSFADDTYMDDIIIDDASGL